MINRITRFGKKQLTISFFSGKYAVIALEVLGV